LALVFVPAGSLGVLATIVALCSRFFRQLRQAFDDAAPVPAAEEARVGG